MQREATFREEGLQRQGTLAELLQVLRPVDLNTAFHCRRTEDERTIDKVVQSGWDQNAFQEGIHPHAQRTGRTQERLQGLNAHLHFRPAQQGEPGAGDHEEKREDNDKRGALENPQENRKRLVEKAVVDSGNDARNDNSADDAGIERFDTCDHRQTASGYGFGRKINTKEMPPGHTHRIDKVVPGQEAN